MHERPSQAKLVTYLWGTIEVETRRRIKLPRYSRSLTYLAIRLLDFRPSPDDSTLNTLETIVPIIRALGQNNKPTAICRRMTFKSSLWVLNQWYMVYVSSHRG
jgi:hypothetical protein